MEKISSGKTASLIFSSVVFCFAVVSLSFAAWQGPQGVPPANNVYAPINISANAQGKLGNLGIGTASPLEALHVVGNVKIGGANKQLIFNSSSDVPAWNSAAISAYDEGGNYKASLKFFTNSGGGNTNLSEAMRITSSGNVGIGTTTPSKKLEIVGGPTKTTGGLIIETTTSDPGAPETGRMWLRTDINN
ncbi:MAG: hypothetical protein NT155_01840 [Candidatus Staskawiczbacteria bacterium]|nr:hypothetical protein [Candidatus Staskawiczbacteria bacterium]